MQTPGHVIINLALLGPFLGPAESIVLGATLPDVPIVCLYSYQRLVHHTPEESIWAVHYQKRFWLNLVHGAHSIPISAIGGVTAWLVGYPVLAAFFFSAMLHALLDFPVHARDAHRHFLPFSQYRFVSPLSYWDVHYHGKWVALFEAALVLVCSSVVWSRGVGMGATLALVTVNLLYAINYWKSFLSRAAQPDADMPLPPGNSGSA